MKSSSAENTQDTLIYERLGPEPSEKGEYDRGYSWVVALIGFTIQFFAIGLLNNLGLCITQWKNSFPEDGKIIGFVASMVYGLTFFCAPLSAILAENLGSRVLGIFGTILCSLAMFLTSFVNNPKLLTMSFGLLLGLGNSFLFFCSIMVVPYYFQRHRSTANGLITSGSGIGSLAVGLMMEKLFEVLSWQAALRFFALVYLLLTIPICFIIPKGNEVCPCSFILSPFDKSRYAKVFQVFKIMRDRLVLMMKACVCTNPQFSIFLLSCSIFISGYIAPFLFLNRYAISLIKSNQKTVLSSKAASGIELSTTQREMLPSESHDRLLAASLIGILCVFSSISRFCSGYVVARFKLDVRKIVQGAFFTMGLAYICIPFIKNISHLVVPVAIAGVSEGFYVSLTVPVVEKVNGEKSLNSAVGILYCAKAFPVFCSGYFLSYLHETLNSFSATFTIAGSALILSSLIMFLLYFVPAYPVDVLASADNSEKSFDVYT